MATNEMPTRNSLTDGHIGNNDSVNANAKPSRESMSMSMPVPMPMPMPTRESYTVELRAATNRHSSTIIQSDGHIGNNDSVIDNAGRESYTIELRTAAFTAPNLHSSTIEKVSITERRTTDPIAFHTNIQNSHHIQSDSDGHTGNDDSVNVNDNAKPSRESYTVELRTATNRHSSTIRKLNFIERRTTDPNNPIAFHSNIQDSHHIQSDSERESTDPRHISEKVAALSVHRIDFSLDLATMRHSLKLTILDFKPVVCSVAFLMYDRHHLNRFYIVLINLIMPSISIFTISMLAYHFKEPFIFPSLGPTAFLHFDIPDHPPSSPLNTIFGHLLGIAVGYTALIMTGLQNEKAVFVEGITFERIVCASLSIGITCFLMIILLLNHPPAAATALIVALGILSTFQQFGIMMCAVIIFTVQSFILNRIIRSDAVYPLCTRNGEKILNHLKKLCQCHYIYNGRTGACALCKYERSDMKFVHVLLINLLCPAVGLGIIGIIGFYTNLPFLFPSLGPTAFVQFAIFQEAPASPKNTLIGHLIGIIFGYLGLLIFGLTDNPSVAVEGISMDRVGCIVFALGFTCVLMVSCKMGHPPAAATTLIVAMGILKEYSDLAVLMGTVIILTIFAFIANRILRTDAIYPIWGKVEEAEYTIHRSLRRQDVMRGVLEEEMGYHHFPSL